MSAEQQPLPPRPSWMPPRPGCDRSKVSPYRPSTLSGTTLNVCTLHGYTWLDGHPYCNGVPEDEEALHEALDTLVARVGQVLNDMRNTSPRDDYFIGRLTDALDRPEPKGEEG